MFIPVTSPGSRSGVNCILANSPETEAASDLASLVFPVPGISCNSTWPSEKSAASSIRTVSSFPTITLPIFSVRSFPIFSTCPISMFPFLHLAFHMAIFTKEVHIKNMYLFPVTYQLHEYGQEPFAMPSPHAGYLFPASWSLTAPRHAALPPPPCLHRSRQAIR